MKIEIYSVHKKLIRHDQVGDWWYDNNSIKVHVLQTLSPDSQFAVAIHELTEAWECRKHGITDDQVCAFDQQYEAERKEGKHKEDDEPGDDPRSPYRKEHISATHVEYAACAAIGLNWKEHCQLDPGLEEGRPKIQSPACDRPL